MTPLFARVLGDAAFSTLPQRVQALHREQGMRTYAGGAEVESATGYLARLCAWAAGLPLRGGVLPVRVTIESDESGERWQREFGAQRMSSRFWADCGLLHERIGPVTFAFELRADNGALLWRVRRVRVFGLPLPLRWFAGVTAQEREGDGRYRFDVRAALPVAGLLVHYRGWLAVAS